MVVRIDIPKVSQDAIDEVVAEVTRNGSIGPKSSLLPLLTPWLLKITDAESFDVCTYTMSRNAFGDWMTDRVFAIMLRPRLAERYQTTCV
jgi:hypothetical protein